MKQIHQSAWEHRTLSVGGLALRVTAWAMGSVIAMLLLPGCTSTEAPPHASMASQGKPARPNRILVYDFAVTAADIPADAPVGARLAPGTSPPPEQLARDRQLGEAMGAQLVAAIRQMGLPAERASADAVPQPNDVLIRGCFVSRYGANTAKPPTIGFDFSASELLTAVEGFQITPQGLAHLPAIGATTGADGNPPGVLFTTAMKVQDQASFRAQAEGWAKQSVQEIAERARTRFREQGWIQ
jgi:hypothetical protein